ncbi:MAG: activity regulator of membrane protease YbbK [Gammaproteobacteria bacterium]|nr:activity regulator of membrane protease YbbK [Gammaproteobacteria bacterium]
MNAFFDFPLVYLPEIFFAIGILFLLIEIVFLGFSTFVLFFLAIGCIATSFLLFLGTIPLAVDKALLATSLISVGSAVVLWRFLKQLTSEKNESQVDEGFVNHEFTLSETISRTSPGSYRYSSVTWQVVPYKDVALQAGMKVEVVSVEVGRFFVQEKVEEI